MHASPAGFTWGNTAASAVFVLGGAAPAPPLCHWAPTTPCTSLYLPLDCAALIAGPALPPILAAAGTAG